MSSRVGAWLLARSLAFLGLLLMLGHALVPSVRPALPLAGAFGLCVALFAAVFAARWVERRTDARARAAENEAGQALASAHAELTEERDRLRGILAGMEEGVLLLDEQGRVAFVNSALREMLLLGADAVGMPLLDAVRHEELKEIVEHARQGEAITGEIELEGLKPRRLLVRAVELPGAAGEVFAVFVDVTEVRKLESLRRDFVANVSHELRTPVTAIRSAAETLQTAIPEDPQVLDQFIAILARNAERLHGLVEDLLDLSRIESQKLKLAPEPLEVKAVFAQVLSLFRERADKKRIDLVNGATASGVRLLADRRALEHVLTNLVDNAVKYCGEGSRVTLRAEEDSEGVRLFVADDGPGIEERHLPRLFERFYRVDAGRSRERGGTGLGLSIVKHLSEAMGGAVGVESRSGTGTTFIVTLKKAEPRSTRAVA